MGSGTDRMSTNGSGRVEEVSHEIDTLRGSLGGLVAELDRRRHEAMDVRLQIRRHPLAAALAVGAVALVAGGLVALAVAARRRRESRAYRVRQMRRAVGRFVEDPRSVARERGLFEKIIAAAGGAAAGTLAKRLVTRVVKT
jgi:hypothetical protein